MRPHDPTLDAPLSAAVQQVGPARLLRRLGMGASAASVLEAVPEQDTACGARVAMVTLHVDCRAGGALRSRRRVQGTA